MVFRFLFGLVATLSFWAVPSISFRILKPIGSQRQRRHYFHNQPRRRTSLHRAIPTRRDWLIGTTAAAASSALGSSNMASADSAETIAKQPPLNVAILGAGIFAKMAHAPALLDHPELFRVRAVWSRTLASAEALAKELDCGAVGISGDGDLEEKILQDSSIDCVVMSLPLDVQPLYIRQCLAAGKHVLSEKPIGPTLSSVDDLVRDYNRGTFGKVVWSVGENFRYEPGILAMQAAVQGVGRPIVASLQVRAPFLPNNQFLNTPWRKNASWYGGLFIDSFIHHAAGLRTIFGEILTVSAQTSSQADYLPGVDTMAAHVRFASGLVGVVSVTYAGGASENRYELEVTGTEGRATLTRTPKPGYQLSVSGETEPSDFGFAGVPAEFVGFAEACRGGAADRNSPNAAMADLALVEALLESGRKDGKFVQVKQQWS